MKISFIVPVYNVEKYLVRCLDSILGIKSVDWECILIDDGSVDCSWDIICRYARISDRFIARKKENGGVSSARNLGLELCSGDWIMFVDSDDYFFPEVDQLLHKAVIDYADYDMVLFRWSYVFPNGTKRVVEIPKADYGNDVDWIKKTALVGYTMSDCWAKLFKYSIIDKNKLRFDTTMRIAEDGCFVMEYLQYLHTITVVNDGIMYAYCQNGDSTLMKFYKNDIFDLFQKYEKIFELAGKRNISISMQEKREIDSFFFNSICAYTFRCARNCSRKQFKNIMDDVLNNEKVLVIINNYDIKSDILGRKFSKFLVRNKFFSICWYLVRTKDQIRNLSVVLDKE